MAFVPIQSRPRAKQLINFEGIEFGVRIWPMDLDALIEWRNKAWLIFEVKMYDKDVPKGQSLALERFVQDAYKAGKMAVAVVVEHHVLDTDKDVTLADCMVREIYTSGENQWRPTNRPMTAQEFADKYISYVETRTQAGM